MLKKRELKMNSERKRYFLQGNIAVGEAAIMAGARFYAGYPITPSSEIAEHASVHLPGVGGTFIQMEDEIGSLTAVIGASMTGAKAYTATSGPGISLMSESIGLACMVEAPCVIISVQRVGPSTGLATKPAQGDFLQFRHGTHGDHMIIALSPASVQECFDLTIQAFNFAERFRCPVFLALDGIIGKMYETVEIPESSEIEVIDRKKASGVPEDFKPYQYDEDLVPRFAPFGSAYISKANGSGHGIDGYPCADTESHEQLVRRLINKIDRCKDEISLFKEYHTHDAEILIITYGCTTRPAIAAMKEARKNGIKVGVLQLQTLWPFPEKVIRSFAIKAKLIIIPELSLGQFKSEVVKYSS
ncbi:MAG: 2-oxoacid:acceptor oxidoreductase subunit alpha, partial [Candidatus Atribacteria bacterium]|nr:2-oxoacid:acceptor oxidoreductase subunit alpha [Candidatus Atribacteria bacterium]